MATTDLDLRNALDRLNSKAGTPLDPLSPIFLWNVGCFSYNLHKDTYQLEQVINEDGAMRSFGEFGTQLELLLRIEAMIDGINVAKGGK